MVSQPRNPEFRINPENFHLCTLQTKPLRSSAYEVNVTINHTIVTHRVHTGKYE